MLKKILAAFAVLVVVVLAFAATRPNTFQVERQASIDASPEQVYALLDDFHQWEAWSPWEKLDPQMQRTHSGAVSGRGAVYEWDGNRQVGAGRMEIVESIPPTQLAIQLDFLRPFETRNTTVFTLEPRGDATHVIWSMHGDNNYVGKLMSVFFNMDRMIGSDFEEGLATLKRLAEEEAASVPEDDTESEPAAAEEAIVAA